MSGSKPDYTIKVNEKGSKYGTPVGVAWVNKTQSGAEYLSIQMNPGCLLTRNKDETIRAWKNDGEQPSNFSSPSATSAPVFEGPSGGEKAMWE